MNGSQRAGTALVAGAALSLVVALVARLLMRLVAVDTLGVGSFSAAGTLSICVLFVLAGAGAAVLTVLVRRRSVLVVGVLLTAVVLWYSGMAIGLSSFEFATERPMTVARWIGFWALFAAIMALAGLTTALGVRVGRRYRPPASAAGGAEASGNSTSAGIWTRPPRTR